MTSPFDPRAAVAENALAFAVRDRFPVSEGHTLVVPRREPVATWFHATRDEQVAILELQTAKRSVGLRGRDAAEARSRGLPGLR